MLRSFAPSRRPGIGGGKHPNRMRTWKIRLLSSIPVLLAGMLLCGCALQVKVREDWHDPLREVIPLREAAAAWDQIRRGTMPTPEQLELYNESVVDTVVQIADNWESQNASLSVIQTSDGPIRVGVEAINLRNVDLIEEVIPADFMRVKKGFDEVNGVEGVGAGLLVRQAHSEKDPMIPATGLWYPVTGVLNFDQPHRPVLQLIDPTRQPLLRFQGGAVPLEVNYTATLARDLQDRQAIFARGPALLRFEKFADRMGMYRVSAYDPAKQVCILVHGINSSPMTWIKFLNSAYGDPQIRARYEFWTFGYPTGAPIPYLASEFRDSVRALIEFREQNGAEEDDLVIVGHSMGGLLAKSTTQFGGDSDWDKLFNVPIEELEVSKEDREVLRRMVYYRPIPQVERVVLAAVPHRGSKLASKPAAKLVGDLVQVPRQLAEVTTEIVRQSSYALTPAGMELAKKQQSSLDQLRPTSQVTAEFLKKPLNPGVKFYSVIGNKKGPDTPPEKMSDGVVAYESAHIEGVVSEKVIHGSDHGVHRTEGGIREILRILRLP